MIKEKRTICTANWRRRHYGPLPEFLVANDAYLPRMVLRAGILADLQVQKADQDNEKQVYMSNFLKRCGIIKDIKKRAWSAARSGKK